MKTFDDIDGINDRDVNVSDVLLSYSAYDVRSHENPPVIELYAGAYVGKPLPEDDFQVQEIARALCIFVEDFLIKDLGFDYFATMDDKRLQRHVWGGAFAESAKRFGLEKLFDSPRLDLTQKSLANMRRYFPDAYYRLFGTKALLGRHPEKVPTDWLGPGFSEEEKKCALCAGVQYSDVFLGDSVVDELFLLEKDDYIKEFLRDVDIKEHSWLLGALTRYPVSDELQKFLTYVGVSPKNLIQWKEWVAKDWIFGERDPQERLMFYQELVSCDKSYHGYDVTKDMLLDLAKIFGAHLIDLSKNEDKDISRATFKTLKKVSKEVKSGYVGPKAIIPALAGVKPNRLMRKWPAPCQAYASATGDYEILEKFLDSRYKDESFSESVQFKVIHLLRPSSLVDMWGKYLVSRIDPIAARGLENKYYNSYIQEFYDGDGALTITELYEKLKGEAKPCEKKRKPWVKNLIKRIKELLKR